MKKILMMVMVMCMLIMCVPVADASGGDEYYYAIQNYDQLIEWKENGYPDEAFCLAPEADFGWPTAETVIDFTNNGRTDGLPMYGGSITIPENVTIKNLSLNASQDASVVINGKWYNESYTYNGYPFTDTLNITTSITLGKNTEVKGDIRLSNGAVFSSNGATVESIVAANYNGTSGTGRESAEIYGTVKASRITLHKMDLYLMDGCDLTIQAVRPISGSGETTLYINGGAQVTFIEKNGSFSIASNIKVMSGGKLNTLANFPRPEYTLTIEAGGEVKAYEGFEMDENYTRAAIKGSGTINLYGWGNPFRAGGREYDYNPGDISGVDSTIVIKSVEDCDHAGGKAMLCLPDYTDREQKTHLVRCFCCWEEVEGTKEQHKYVMTGDYDWGTRYECACGSNKNVNKSSGSCGDDVNFSLAYNKLTIDGSGETSGFSAEDAPWASETENIEEIKIGDNVTGIGANAFEGCTALEKVTISSDVTKIEASAFASCDSLEKVEYDGTYEQWKEMDVKEGNDAFLYAEIVFNDDSKLLAPVKEYCGKTDVLFKTSESQETTSMELSIIPDENKIDREELNGATVYVAVYDEKGKMEKLESLLKTNAENGIGFSGDMPTENNFKILIWSKMCIPMTNSITGN